MLDQPSSPHQPGYGPGYGTAAHQYMAVRSAADAAGFLIPHLRSGMRLLDCGCGPGSISVGLAAAIAPGDVVGVDREPLQIERARHFAAEQGVGNVRFEVADLLALPFPDASFDIVFAHAVLMHVPDRSTVLREFRRLPRPGGLVAVKDLKTDHQILEPASPPLSDFLDLLVRVGRHNGVPTLAPHRYRALLSEHGFVDVEASASCSSYGTLDQTRRIAAFHLEQACRPRFQETVREQGWADQVYLDALTNAIQTWGEQPDAFRVELWCAAIGRVPE